MQVRASSAAFMTPPPTTTTTTLSTTASKAIPVAQKMSPAAQKYLNSALDLIELRAVNRARLNWPVIRQQALNSAVGAVIPSDTYGAISLVVGDLDVNGHSHLIPQPILPTHPTLPPGPSQLTSGRLLPGQLGYIALPGIDQSLTTPYLAHYRRRTDFPRPRKGGAPLRRPA